MKENQKEFGHYGTVEKKNGTIENIITHTRKKKKFETYLHMQFYRWYGVELSLTPKDAVLKCALYGIVTFQVRKIRCTQKEFFQQQQYTN